MAFTSSLARCHVAPGLIMIVTKLEKMRNMTFLKMLMLLWCSIAIVTG